MNTRQAPYDDPTDSAMSAEPVDLPGLADDVGPADRLTSVVAINVSLIDRILQHSGELEQQRHDGVITEQAYGGEMYRLAKAVRHANGAIVGRLAGHLPLPVAAVYVGCDARSADSVERT
jgi:hypothetical protein